MLRGRITALTASCFVIAAACSIYEPDLLMESSDAGPLDAPGHDGSGPGTPPLPESGADAGRDATVPPFDGGGLDTQAGVDVVDASVCPGTAGPSGVRLIVDGGTSFCIDSTEVTNAQYAEFLAAGFPTSQQPSACAFNATYTPSVWPYLPAFDNHPVVNVNWCDAYAYCTWAGKRLCGAIGGGHNDGNSGGDPSKSQWTFACSHGGDGQHTYAYGNTYVPGVCNDVNREAGVTLDVTSEPGCVGGFPGVFDMSGNVWEFDDSCFSPDSGGLSNDCSTWAGSFTTPGEQTQCAFGYGQPRSYSANNLGFRCCSNP